MLGAAREEERLGGGQLDLGRALEQLEDASAERDGDAHDDALGDAGHGVDARVDGGLEEMIRRLLEGGEHQDALAHLGHQNHLHVGL